MFIFFLIAVFVIGYIAIAFEHPLRLNKAASAMITGVLCWTIYMFSSASAETVTDELLHHLGEIASILFFLLGAMTIVELIDTHNGFEFITRHITTRSKSRLLIIVVVITFFLSALLDNLTTAIVMASLCARLLKNKEDKLWFCGMIVISANAGGAWSPLGDVTTTMLWIGGQITALNIMKQLILPSLVVCALPLALVAWRFRGQQIDRLEEKDDQTKAEKKDGLLILFSGIGFLVFVPVFKTLTHLPPFMGMLLALGLMWVITTFLHKDKEPEQLEKLTVARALQKVDSPSILFFLGILLAVSSLQSAGLLQTGASWLSNTLGNDYMIGSFLGLLSAVVDNVPLVAASQGMYDLQTYPTDHPFWEFLALTTGTGGSAIIIGSAAGVAVMGIEKIDFMWYLRNISWLALIGFAGGIAVFLLQMQF
ncbi:MAG TPA: sodium:proton antiporter NhaD [Chitinophagaceae bacterium]|nr:sodium:proton antiporter NhaD [Chitinophagaceae bacterium]HPH31088.1 sodium:proton antiporter NhaD [Chitinophagaceae bacterium]HPN58062.1 sodium:proton antiporter NhaD [Chitinophagaceae bacterium]